MKDPAHSRGEGRGARPGGKAQAEALRLNINCGIKGIKKFHCTILAGMLA